MKAPDFDYLRPDGLEAALALLARHDGTAMPLAGGQSLMPMMNFRVAAPDALIDLADVTELRGITHSSGTVRIGAMTTYATLLSNSALCAEIPLLAIALPHVAHDAIRNRGTIGGSVALADPAAEMPALMLALDATVEIAGTNGTRQIKADDFFLGVYDTALETDELITALHVPTAQPSQSFGFHELTQRHGDYALAGVAVARSRTDTRVAFFGIADRALRVPALEQALHTGESVDAALSHLDHVEFAGDLKAGPATRKRLAGVALTRALKEMST